MGRVCKSKTRHWFESYIMKQLDLKSSLALLPFPYPVSRRGQSYPEDGELNEKNFGLGNIKHR